MAEIHQEMQAGRHGHAVQKLMRLAAWKPDSDEAAYLLGMCEKARGQAMAAYQAWERVSPRSEFGARAIRGRMDLLLERGRLADAEKLTVQAIADPTIDGSELRLFLGLIYSLQGRVDEAERVIETSWNRLEQLGDAASETAILLVRLHIDLWREAPPIAEIRASLDQSAHAAQQDDRAMLGRAKLATRAGAYEEAGRLLAACLRQRPDDIAVWRAQLDWALATHRLEEVRKALTHLRVDGESPGTVERLKAWLAAERGDLDGERQALERLIAIQPADFDAIDRLVAIARKEGKSERAEELLGTKTKLRKLKARYRALYERNQTIRNAREMAGLAEQLGRPFEAKALLVIAIANEIEPDPLRERLRRLDAEAAAFPSPPLTLAEALASELDTAKAAVTR
jgi:tetratricopeptide (TPR) repeat protein